MLYINNVITRFNVIYGLLSGFFFSFASKCIPTFFSVFLINKGYNTRDIILISSLFFLGSLTVGPNRIKNHSSVKVFQIFTILGSIILHFQGYVNTVWVWFFFRFMQGMIDMLCRNALNNIIHDRYLHQLAFFMNFGSTMGFLLMCYPGAFNMLFTITGILLNLAQLAIVFHKEGIEHGHIVLLKSDQALNTMFSILKANYMLFFTLFLSTFLTSTFSTILPITLKNNGFVIDHILIIMFIGSLGQTFLRMTTFYFQNIFGNFFFLRILVYLLIILYIIFIFSINYMQNLSALIVFFIIGIHFSIVSVLTSIFREIHQLSHRLIRHGLNQITNVGSIVASIFSLFFVTSFPRYGLFIIWIITVILIYLVVNHLNKNYEQYIL